MRELRKEIRDLKLVLAEKAPEVDFFKAIARFRNADKLSRSSQGRGSVYRAEGEIEDGKSL